MSSPGRGTEVRIIMPRTDSGAETDSGTEEEAGAGTRADDTADVVVEQPLTRPSGSAVRAEQR
ncbi:hypothetical protein [Nocardia cyriacigeorgica]|uniref:hypothetical protein n=1 Tax=Nocardia cyriacigeorgica TaxID=135487 RepID=UPI003CC7F158